MQQEYKQQQRIDRERERQSSSEAGHTHTHTRAPHSRPAISDSPAGHAVHAEPVLEIKINKYMPIPQSMTLYVDPDVYNNEDP